MKLFAEHCNVFCPYRDLTFSHIIKIYKYFGMHKHTHTHTYEHVKANIGIKIRYTNEGMDWIDVFILLYPQNYSAQYSSKIFVVVVFFLQHANHSQVPTHIFFTFYCKFGFSYLEMKPASQPATYTIVYHLEHFNSNTILFNA